MPLFPSPLVSRKRYDKLVEWKRQALESLARWDKVSEFVRASSSAQWGGIVQDEILHLLQSGAADAARISELEAPEAATKRSIAETEAKIELAELEAKLRRMKDDPDDENRVPEKVKIERVYAIAAQARARRFPRQT